MMIGPQLATKTDLKRLKHDLTIRIGGMMVALGAFLVTLAHLVR